MTRVLQGGCSCGAVRYQVTGEPILCGICHCTSCRKESGSAFTAYAQWPLARFATTGVTREFDGRSFCPACGSRLFALDTEKAEIKIGSLDDAPVGIPLDVELWIKRREPWLVPVKGAAQHREDAPRVLGGPARAS